MSISFINKGKCTSDSLKPNIFVQETEPEIKDGIWLQSNLKYNQIIIDKNVGESEIDISENDTEKLIPYDLYVSVYANGYIYIFNTRSNGTCLKYDVINGIYSEISKPTEEQRSTIKYEGIYIEERNQIVFLYQTKMLIFDILSGEYILKSIKNVSVYMHFLYKNGYIYSIYNQSKVIAKINLDTGESENIEFDNANLVASVMDCEMDFIYLIMKDNTVKKYSITTSEITDFVTLSGYGLSTTLSIGNTRPYYSYMLKNKKVYYVTKGDVNGKRKYILVIIDFNSYSASVKEIEQIDVNGTHFNTYFIYDNLSDTFYLLIDDKYFIKININQINFEKNSLIISTKLKYQIKLIPLPENFVGNLVSYFNDAWIFDNKLITSIPTYYGNGTEWIKFKN